VRRRAVKRQEKKTKAIDLSCWRSSKALRLQFLKAFNMSFENIFGTRVAVVISHALKYPELEEMPLLYREHTQRLSLKSSLSKSLQCLHFTAVYSVEF